MKAQIITIGDEILVGQTVDTNSTFIAQKLNELGINVSEIRSITDTEAHIISSLNDALTINEIVIITGGLGPTNDDITKNVLVKYFNDELIIYPEILEKVKNFFKRFNKPFLEVNYHQAMLPKKADIILNDQGTASGMWFNIDGKVVVSLPGVPYEMKALMLKVVGMLKDKFSVGNLYHQTLLFQGIGEGYLANEILDWEKNNREKGISVAYLPSVGLLKVRLTGHINQTEDINESLKALEERYKKYVFGYNEDNLAEKVGALLKQSRKTLGVVESCTGGALASKIVSIAGSSDYFNGGIISYTNILKEKLVGVKKDTINNFGAVSQQTAEEMATNGLNKLNVDYCISITGIAGPGGGSEEKPVGTVWIAVAEKGIVSSKMFNFGHSRTNNIKSTVNYALNYLRRIILKLEV